MHREVAPGMAEHDRRPPRRARGRRPQDAADDGAVGGDERDGLAAELDAGVVGGVGPVPEEGRAVPGLAQTGARGVGRLVELRTAGSGSSGGVGSASRRSASVRSSAVNGPGGAAELHQDAVGVGGVDRGAEPVVDLGDRDARAPASAAGERPRSSRSAASKARWLTQAGSPGRVEIGGEVARRSCSSCSSQNAIRPVAARCRRRRAWPSPRRRSAPTTALTSSKPMASV